MSIRLDDVNKRIIHALMGDARNTSAPMIADEVGVSPATIRNRINQLEDAGVIRGYHANVDFDAADEMLTTLYVVSVPIEERARLAQQARTITGVINVREFMAGEANLHVLAVGDTVNALNDIARELTSLGAEITDEKLVQTEQFQSYHPFGPTETHQQFSDYISLAGGNEVVELTVDDDAPIAGMTLEEAGDAELLEDGVLVVSIERDDTVLTPQGESSIRAGDILTVLSRGGFSDATFDVFETETS
ncbi:Lrp/AsnC family transcriptional regulator [Natronorubrum daqingense]|uniref:AsnC family transcriptional regulator n=1 Tax=Natronorubrum daqingense TaxID=588898 RepID=A0A1N7DRB6_9EURY|nr:Lrp/AsnC family transcriptional regulator [Natronorubrum daqingense]APX96122.1 AsnC family transcriptional regulator [Natronorubrum daqingense]SIR78301.1 DNA-binding transcriptional regulator, Lrp family [Natronorubrum daqingense]